MPLVNEVHAYERKNGFDLSFSSESIYRTIWLAGRVRYVRALTPKLAALLDQGLESHKSGDFSAALKLYDVVLKKRPNQPDALWLKGVVALNMGDPESAIELINRAVRGRPKDPDILNDLGASYEATADFGEARGCFESALALKPGAASVLVSIARCHFREGNSSKALEVADDVINSSVMLGQANNIRGLALKDLGRAEDALEAFISSLSYEPDNAAVLTNKGELQRAMRDYADARSSLERARSLSDPGSLDWLNATMTLGLLRAGTGQGALAQECYNAVLAHEPNHVQTLNNRGELYQAEGDIEAAESDFNAVLAVNSWSLEAKYNLGRVYLLKHLWSDGWDLLENRWDTAEFRSQNRSRGRPLWNGAASTGRDLIVWGEQGLGDQILFASQIPDLLSRVPKASLEIDPRLVPLFKRSFPDTDVYAYDARLDQATAAVQVPIGSLGRYLRRSDTDFETQAPFLVADAKVTSSLRERYLKRAKGRKIVGIAWHSINPVFGEQKSLPLDEWQPILSHHRDVLFVSLQYGNVSAPVQRASKASGADIFVDAEIDPITDFDAAAAQIAAMDLIIATSNTAVHVAGALGKPTWVMVPKVPEWRWGLEGESIPWYPSVKVYRQKEQGDWSAALTALDGDLQRFLSVE